MNRVVDTIKVGNDPAGIAYANSAVWVANTGDHTITRIDVGERQTDERRWRSPRPGSRSVQEHSGPARETRTRSLASIR